MSLSFNRWELPHGSNISALIPTDKRRGIYVLEFEDGSKYVGLSENVVTRFSTHARGSSHHDGWSDITAISFAHVPEDNLAPLERRVINEQRRLGIALRNHTHNLGTLGSTGLDQEFAVTDQQHWIQGNWADAEFDFSAIPEATNPPLTKLESHSSDLISTLILNDLAYALQELIPKAPELEKTFWSLSDYPSTSGGRYATLNTGVLEFIVWPRNLTGDFFQGGNPIPTAFLNTLISQQDAALMRRYDDEFGAEFQDFAAPHYLRIHDYDVHPTLSVYFPAGSLRQLLESSPELKSEARQFAVTLMRYRKGNLFQRWHSSALTQRVYSHIKAQST